MQQRLQFIASFVHDPEVLFLDEPFQGLDPLNVDRIKRLILALHEQGKTIVLSSHQMDLVEALCDRILLVNHGKRVLYGDLAEIKRRYAPNAVRVRAPFLPPDLPGVAEVRSEDGSFYLTLIEGRQPNEILRALIAQDVEVEAFEVASVPLEQIFIAAVKEGVE
jgi:ABC-2 type transport system ATP-binding protein